MARGEVNLVELDPSRLRAAAELLARAFDDDPMMECLLPEPPGRAARAAWLMGACARYGMLYGTVRAAADLGGVSIWLPPGGTHMGLWRMFRAGWFAAPTRLGWAAFRRFVQVDRFSEQLHHRLMPEPHWYLFMLAVEPSRQRQGLGGALLAAGLAPQDQEGLPVYLETSKSRNVAYYRQHGFNVLAEETSAGLSLPLWAMARQPQKNA